ncbi:MAG: PilZ domain-containing protein [Lachnospiraceae bacterium]|nr:PilZ domain-containing protein [Lachnospiraceae bacterium]
MNTIDIGTKVNLYRNNFENAGNMEVSFKDAEVVKRLSYDRYRVQIDLPEGADIRVGLEYFMEYRTDFGTMHAKAVIMAYDFEEENTSIELRLLTDFEPFEKRHHYRLIIKKKFVAQIIDSNGELTGETVNMDLSDISCSGFRTISERYVAAKTVLHFNISFDKGDEFEFNAEVLNSRKARNYKDSYELRCRFLDNDINKELSLLKVIFDMASE